MPADDDSKCNNNKLNFLDSKIILFYKNKSLQKYLIVSN